MVNKIGSDPSKFGLDILVLLAPLHNSALTIARTVYSQWEAGTARDSSSYPAQYAEAKRYESASPAASQHQSDGPFFIICCSHGF